MRRVLGVSLLLGMGAAAVCCQRQAAPPGAAGDEVSLPSRWFMGQRLAAGRVPARARGRALDEARAAGLLVAAPGTWVPVGPQNIGGRITAIALNPAVPNRIWIGAAEGGVFRTDDGGTTWTPVFDGQTALSIGSLAVDPLSPNTVYAGTGEDNGGGYSYDGEGVFRTTDGGATWQALGLAETRRIGRIAIDPSDPRRLFVAAGGDWFSRDANRGVYRSQDSGATWEKVLYVADDTGGIDLAIDPSNPRRVYAALWQRLSLGTTWSISGPNSGVYRSEDGGTTWTRLSNGLPAGPDVGRIGLAVSPSRPSTVYALVIDGTGQLLGLFRTNDSGATWSDTQAFVGLGGFSYYFGNVRVDPAKPDTVYIVDTRIFRATDGGHVFTLLAKSEHLDWHDLIILGRRMLAANDSGFYQSTNGGSGWTKLGNLPITQLYSLAVDRFDPAHRLAGAQDNGTIRSLTADPAAWDSVLDGDGLQCAIDSLDPTRVYAEYHYGEIQRSTNGGSSFVAATTGIDPAERTNWNTPITLDPVVPTTLYTGAQRVYRSIDAAVSWTPISPDLTGTGGAAGAGGAASGGAVTRQPDHLMDLIRGTITVVSVSPADPRVLWAGTDTGSVWVSSDTGGSWTDVTPPGPALWVTGIACDPFVATAAYLTVTGYRQGDRLPYIRSTTDLGTTWTDRSGGLPAVPVNTVVADPATRGRLFAGTDLGVHLSDDGGASWRFMSGGLPYVVVMDLVLHDASRTLFAATYGRSAYAFDLRQLPVTDSDGDGVDNNHDCAPADPGAFSLPVEAGPLAVAKDAAGRSILSWPSQAAAAGPGTTYDVAKGKVADLAGGGTASSVPLVCGLTVTSASDTIVPPPGEGIYYLVRARNSCGAGIWGRDDAGNVSISAACP